MKSIIHALAKPEPHQQVPCRSLHPWPPVLLLLAPASLLFLRVRAGARRAHRSCSTSRLRCDVTCCCRPSVVEFVARIEPRARFGLGASDDGGSGPAAGSPGPQSAPAAVGGASSAPGASGSDGKPPVKRVMKTPYQLEVLERTYAGSSAIDDSETF